MSETLCRLCNREITGTSDSTDKGFWAVTIEDSSNPEVARAHPVHTNCIGEKYREVLELALSDSLPESPSIQDRGD